MFSEFLIPAAPNKVALPQSIATGSDGALWFVVNSNDGTGDIGRVTTTGSFTFYPVSASAGGLLNIVAGADSALWFVDNGEIGRITTGGSISIVPGGQSVNALTAGPDGAMWCTESTGFNCRVTSGGTFTQYAIPTAAGEPDGITAGPDLREDVDVEWLAQHPVTEVLRRRGERIHPASALFANESAHIESECGEHDLHAFGAIRRMDEILMKNFMVFHDLTREEHFDLVIGDEAWDVDHFLHENPNGKRSAFVWMADFVGWLPMPEGGEYEARLTTDYNAEMIEHVERHSSVRDRSVFIGDPEDIVPERNGEGLPLIRE